MAIIPPFSAFSSAALPLAAEAAVLSTTALVAETLEQSRFLIVRRGEGVRHESRQLGLDGHIVGGKFFGVPNFARLVLVGKRTRRLETDPADTIVLSASQVFRHYAHRLEEQTAITFGRTLIPGPLPFTPVGGGSFYHDLVGAFVTLPKFTPLHAGVPDSRFYVDFRFYAGTGLLRLSPRDGRYFMAPGIPRKSQIPIRIIRAGKI